MIESLLCCLATYVQGLLTLIGQRELRDVTATHRSEQFLKVNNKKSMSPFKKRASHKLAAHPLLALDGEMPTVSITGVCFTALATTLLNGHLNYLHLSTLMNRVVWIAEQGGAAGLKLYLLVSLCYWVTGESELILENTQWHKPQQQCPSKSSVGVFVMVVWWHGKRG